MPQNLGRRSFCVDEQLEVLGEGDAWRGQGSSFLTPCPVHFFLLAVSELSVQSVTQLCPTLCDPVDCSMPGLPVYHQLLQLAQTHVH